MSEDPKEFPNVSNKLSAPTKKSIFERQKAEAEAKRLKEEEETAAVYADFVKSFDNEDEDDDGAGGIFAQGWGRSSTKLGGHQPSSGPGKRHFTTVPGKTGSVAGQRASGPGSLGPPPPSFSRKRTHDGTPTRDVGPRGFRSTFEDAGSDSKPAFGDSDDEQDRNVKMKDEDRAASRPTLMLTSLPLPLSTSAIKTLFPASLKVESVKMIPSRAGFNNDRRSASAIVAVAVDTPASELDAAVSALQNRYLGWGFHLSLSRHLSSTAVGATAVIAGAGSIPSLPFGAKANTQAPAASLSRAPPPSGFGRGFAPPASYGPSSGPGRGGQAVQVPVKPPADLRQLKLIHKTVENVISHGPEFEALLMSQPSVQKDEKWAWLWNPRSQGGVWYRWRLWDILTNAQHRIRKGNGRNDGSTQVVFFGGAPWASQERAVSFEYSSNLAELVSESEYNSSDDEDSGDEGRRRLNHLQGGSMTNDQGESEHANYLNPLQKAKLVHLLARLPTSTARLRRGDIARITAFAIKYASEGADEVVELVTRNIHNPFALTSANPERKRQIETRSGDDSDDENPGLGEADRDRDKDVDISSTKLVGLYAMSDILSSSSTSGVRHAWRYRQLFEVSLRKQNTFAHLGQLEKELRWGRLRSEKFKRSVNALLTLWEGWSLFPAPAQEEFGQIFNDPPMTNAEKEDLRRREQEEDKVRKAAASKWRTVDETQAVSKEATGDGDDTPMNNVDGEPMAEDDEDLDGVPMDEDEDVDGEPMDEDEDEPIDDEQPIKNSPETAAETMNAADSAAETTAQSASTAARIARMRRPKAEDMFADTDDE